MNFYNLRSYQKNIHECLTFLSYARERDEVADYEVKQNLIKRKDERQNRG